MKTADPIAYEILQHRLQSAVDEAAISMMRVSGSPVATQIGDLNVAIMDASGEAVLVGQYVVAKATCLSLVVKDVLANYADNPGFGPGDAFICNDPYIGIMHQNDVCVVMPIFHEGELIAWAGADIHQIDVGGPTPGQVQLGARDIFGEAPLMPPMKITEAGRILKDAERNYLRKSRVPELLALDLRAKLAACNTIVNRLHALIAEIGEAAVRQLFEDMFGDAERLFRAKLERIPDGQWSQRTYLEFEDDFYTLQVCVTKRGGAMTLDFAGTSAQAPATINMTLPGVKAWLLGDICETFCWDMPWIVGGIERVYTIEADEGSLVNPRYPAGVSKSTTSIGMLMSTTVRTAFYKMLQCSPAYRDKAMAGWPGSKAQEELHGTNQYGQPFGADILDGMAGGGGAKHGRDGIDTGGLAAAPKIAIANVEHYEVAYPILYLYRRQLPDSGGAGEFRGGNGVDRMYVPHNTDALPDLVMHSIGVSAPVTSGLDGGHPSATNQFMIKRGTGIIDGFARSVLPTDFDGIPGKTEAHGALARSHLEAGDVYRSVSNCGGGFGDPLEREPARVEADLEAGLVSPACARAQYGCILGEDGRIDIEATAGRRRELREARLAAAKPPQKPAPSITCAEAGQPVSTHLVLGRGEDGETYLFFPEASPRALCPAQANYKDYLAHLEVPLQQAGAWIDPQERGTELFCLSIFLDPATGRQLATEIRRRSDAPLADISVSPARTAEPVIA